MNTEEILMIGAAVFFAFFSIPIFCALKESRKKREEENIRRNHNEIKNAALSRMYEEEKYGRHEVTTSPMSPEDIAKIDFGPAAYNNVVTGEYNVAIGYTDVDGRVPESPVMIGGVVCEHCGRINRRDSYYCDGCQAPLDESQAKADRIALRY